jgi:lycopene cyclase domain-containing protein
MTYLTFHLLFILPPILVLARTVPRPLPSGDRWGWSSLAMMALVALVYTTPWDIHMVNQGVWGYERDNVLGTIGGVPIEEYLFFMLQPLLTGLWFYRLLRRNDRLASSAPSTGVRLIGALCWLAVGLAGLVALRSPSTYYLGMILAWAGPVLALQWAYGGGSIWELRRIWLLATLAPTVYLCAADRVAIGQGTWHISEQHTTGIGVFGLPIEEATFFLVTNLMVVQGLFAVMRLLARLHATRSTPNVRSGPTAVSSGGRSR